MLKKIYLWLYRKTATVGGDAEHTSGPWQNAVRQEALNLCGDVGSGRVVEIGCGRGYFLSELAARNRSAQVWGIDHDEKELTHAEKRSKELSLTNAHFALQDATQLSFNEESFDVVVCINLLLSLPSLDVVAACLKNMRRICKKSGYILFDYRNSLNPLVPLKYKLAPYYDRTLKNVKRFAYSPRQIEQILNDLQLDIVTAKYLGFPVRRFAPVIVVKAGKR
ncbi:MAG: class I SAM-dependent methyltransferase [Candidatus Omnitrophica bacterium]|nr:class I SAM-dependent methyltransferase [Candidatus Omnitrophota bacterium]